MRQRDKRRAMRRQRAPELSDLLAHLDEALDVLRPSAIAAHRLDVELLEPLLDPLEGRRVGPEHPLEQRGQKAGASSEPVSPEPDTRSANSSSTGIGSSWAVITQFSPTTHSSGVQLSLVVLVRRVGGDVDVAAVVVEDGPVLRPARHSRVALSSPNASATRCASSSEPRSTSTQSSFPRLSRFGRSARSSRRSTWSRSKRIASLIPTPALGGPKPATVASAIRGAQEAPSDAGQPHQQDRTQSEHGSTTSR